MANGKLGAVSSNIKIIADSQIEEIGKSIQLAPALNKAAASNPGLTLAIANASTNIAESGEFSPEIGQMYLNNSLQLQAAAVDPNFKKQLFDLWNGLAGKKPGITIGVKPGGIFTTSGGSSNGGDNENPASEIYFEILTLINDIPLARMGDIITSEHHNSLRRAIRAIARLFAPAQEKLILTFSPNFLPVNQRKAQQFDWTVTFNKAIVPSELTVKGDNARGAMTLQIPDKTRIRTMVVRGKRETQKENPAEFSVILKRLTFDGTNTKPEDLININLENEKNTFSLTRGVTSDDGSVIDNNKFQYYVEAYWENMKKSDRFEINSVQISCESWG